ncbi:MAG: hypothetical protein JWN29_1473 [Acidimicrobiales bacterium]|nr:hypothetical protein [Acidimicrobiales bacterium]
MERRRALLTSAVATAVLGAGSVTLAVMTDQGVFGFGDQQARPAAAVAAVTSNDSVPTTASTKPRVVTRYQDVYDYYVVPVSPERATGGATPVDPTTRPPTTVATLPTTTAPPDDGPITTQPSTTQPREDADDRPADRSTPPMPAGCRKPQLEDDGTWNCDH